MSDLPENPVPYLDPRAPQAAVFETLRLLAETQDDFGEVAKRRGVSVYSICALLRKNRILIKPPAKIKEDSARHQEKYELAKEAIEAHVGDRNRAAEDLGISYSTLRIWQSYGAALPRKRRARRKGVYKRQTKEALRFIPGVKGRPFTEEELVDLIFLYKNGCKEEALEGFVPYLKYFCLGLVQRAKKDPEELLGPAMLALMNVLDAYDVDKRTVGKHSAAIWRRLRFRLIDIDRSEGEVSRSLKISQKELEGAEERFLHKNLSLPGDEWLLAELGWDQKKLNIVRAAYLRSLDKVLGYTEFSRKLSLKDTIPSRDVFMEGVDVRDALCTLLERARLSDRERFIVGEMLQGKDAREISNECDMSFWVVMQGIKRIRNRLKSLV